MVLGNAPDALPSCEAVLYENTRPRSLLDLASSKTFSSGTYIQRSGGRKPRDDSQKGEKPWTYRIYPF